MFLHEDRALFQEALNSTAAEQNIPVPVVEKDYYVTMILKLLAERAPGCVFKGGTSLSKCHHIIDRFSEDIDITFMDNLTQGQRKKLKNHTIAGISRELALPIVDFEQAKSRRDYNCYTFQYEPLDGYIPESLIQGVQLEISLAATAFPVVRRPVDSYVYQFLKMENMNIVEEYGLQIFSMTVQDIGRTFVDKVFALCDYYMKGKIKRHSRHIYDIHKLLPLIEQNDSFRRLVHEVRVVRQQMPGCPSAQKGVDISSILNCIVEEEIYRKDYKDITAYFQNERLTYETVTKSLKKIADKGLFRDKEFE